MTRYEKLRSAYLAEKAIYDRLERELAVARAKMRAAEREALTEWRKITDTAKVRVCQKAAISPQVPHTEGDA